MYCGEREWGQLNNCCRACSYNGGVEREWPFGKLGGGWNSWAMATVCNDKGVYSYCQGRTAYDALESGVG